MILETYRYVYVQVSKVDVIFLMNMLTRWQNWTAAIVICQIGLLSLPDWSTFLIVYEGRSTCWFIYLFI